MVSLTGTKAGTVTITATAMDGSKKYGAYSVKVVDDYSMMDANGWDYDKLVHAGKPLQLGASYRKTEDSIPLSSNTLAKWELVSGEEYVTLTEGGLLTVKSGVEDMYDVVVKGTYINDDRVTTGEVTLQTMPKITLSVSLSPAYADIDVFDVNEENNIDLMGAMSPTSEKLTEAFRLQWYVDQVGDATIDESGTLWVDEDKIEENKTRKFTIHYKAWFIKDESFSVEKTVELSFTKLPYSHTESGDGYILGRATDDSYKGATSVVLPDTFRGKPVVGVENEMFKDNKTVTSVVLPSGLTTLSDGLFEDCTALKTVTMPNAVTVINECAFKNCTSLETIVTK